MTKWLLPIFIVITSAVFLSQNNLKEAVLVNKPATIGCGYSTLNSTGQFDPDKKVAFFDGQKIISPQIKYQPYLAVLGESTPNNQQKWLDISLDDQKLRAYDGD